MSMTKAETVAYVLDVAKVQRITAEDNAVSAREDLARKTNGGRFLDLAVLANAVATYEGEAAVWAKAERLLSKKNVNLLRVAQAVAEDALRSEEAWKGRVSDVLLAYKDGEREATRDLLDLLANPEAEVVLDD